MSIVGTPTTGTKAVINDSGSVASSGGTVTQTIALGGDKQWTVGTGSGSSMSVVASGTLSLGVSTPATIDLTAYVDPLGTKVFAKIRGFDVEHLGVADAAGTVTVKGAVANGFVGGVLTLAGFTLNPASSVQQDNRNAAGWTVDATHKSVTFDPGTTAQTIKFVFYGE